MGMQTRRFCRTSGLAPPWWIGGAAPCWTIPVGICLNRTAPGIGWERAGCTSIRLLRDEWVWIEAHDARLALLGIEDPGRGWTDRDAESTALERLAQEIPATVPRILLAHRPSYFRQATRLRLDLMLCGHTHGGQISLPAPLQHHNISRLIARWTRGLFEEEETRLYVNRGIGVAGPPVRLNCPREIAVFTLVPRD